MLKLPKGLKKKKKKSKKDQELFTEEELEQYKRDLKAKQEALAAKSDAGESDAVSDVEGSAPSAPVTNSVDHSASAGPSVNTAVTAYGGENTLQKSEADEEWKKFKALTSGVDNILHKTQDELDRIKKESFYQRLPSAAEKKRIEEAKRKAALLAEELCLAAEREANRDKLAEAIVELSDSEEDNDEEVNDIFGTDYVEAIASGELQLAVVPDSPVLEEADGPDPFDTAYAEKIIVGADKAKGNKKLVSLGAAVEVLSGRVDREHALALSKPKRKQRKGIQNLLLSESVDYEECEIELVTPEPPRNLLDELDSEIPESVAPIDLGVSLHLIQPRKIEEEQEEEIKLEAELGIDLSEFDTLKDEEDDEFAELAAESFTKPKDEIKVIREVPLPQPTVLEGVEVDWAEFEIPPEEKSGGKPARPPPPARPATGPHIVPGTIYISDDEGEVDDDPFNTAYAEQVIKKTTVLEEDDDFDPRAEEEAEPLSEPRSFAQIKHNLSLEASEDYDPFDTSAVSAAVQSQTSQIKSFERKIIADNKSENSLEDNDFNPRASVPNTATGNTFEIPLCNVEFDTNRRKSSLSLNLQQKSVGFVVPSQNLLETENCAGGSKKPLTPYYASPNISKDSEDPFDTSYVPEAKPTDVELKHLERDLLQKTTLKHSVSDPDFDPRAPPTPVPAEDLLAVEDNYINTKVLTPAQERKQFTKEAPDAIDPFDTSIAADLRPAQVEIKLLESELLPEKKSEITTGVIDTQTDAQELGLGDKVLTPLAPKKEISIPEEVDPFDTSIANNLAPGQTEIKLLENELIN